MGHRVEKTLKSLQMEDTELKRRLGKDKTNAYPS